MDYFNFNKLVEDDYNDSFCNVKDLYRRYVNSETVICRDELMQLIDFLDETTLDAFITTCHKCEATDLISNTNCDACDENDIKVTYELLLDDGSLYCCCDDIDSALDKVSDADVCEINMCESFHDGLKLKIQVWNREDGLSV